MFRYVPARRELTSSPSNLLSTLAINFIKWCLLGIPSFVHFTYFASFFVFIHIYVVVHSSRVGGEYINKSQKRFDEGNVCRGKWNGKTGLTIALRASICYLMDFDAFKNVEGDRIRVLYSVKMWCSRRWGATMNEWIASKRSKQNETKPNARWLAAAENEQLKLDNLCKLLTVNNWKWDRIHNCVWLWCPVRHRAVYVSCSIFYFCFFFVVVRSPLFHLQYERNERPEPPQPPPSFAIICFLASMKRHCECEWKNLFHLWRCGDSIVYLLPKSKWIFLMYTQSFRTGDVLLGGDIAARHRLYGYATARDLLRLTWI